MMQARMRQNTGLCRMLARPPPPGRRSGTVASAPGGWSRTSSHTAGRQTSSSTHPSASNGACQPDAAANVRVSSGIATSPTACALAVSPMASPRRRSNQVATGRA